MGLLKYLLAFGLLGSQAFAAYFPVNNNERTQTGNITAACPFTSGSVTSCPAGSTVQIVSVGAGTVQFGTSGTWVATMTQDISYDPACSTSPNTVIWFNQTTFDSDVTTKSTFTTWTVTQNNDPWLINTAATQCTRLRAQAFTSGTVVVQMTSGVSENRTAGDSYLQTIASNTSVSATDFIVNGTITAVCTNANINACGANSTVSVTGQGVYTTTASITGTWVATIVFDGQLADNTWIQLPAQVIGSTYPFTQMSSTTANGSFAITGGGFQNIRARASLFTSGTIAVGLESSLSQQTVVAAQSGIWQMQGSVAAGVADSGNPNKVGGKFNSTLPVLANGQRGDVQLDSVNRLIVSFVNLYRHITGANPALLVKTGAGYLHTVCINNAAADTVATIWDNTTNSGTQIGIITPATGTSAQSFCQTYDVAFNTGLTLTTTVLTSDVTVSYQ